MNKRFQLINLSCVTPLSLNTIMKTIDNYTYSTFDTIGRGYSSLVYKGKRQNTNEEVAIKLIDLKFLKGELHRKLLQNQITVLKQLKNTQNIIQIFDVFNTKNSIFIITELCSQDLARAIKNKKIFSESQALSILKQIINGYRSIYCNDIVHRDLKPANIFLSAQTIKIADFGFAVKSIDLKKRQNYNVGSPVYMPYEALNDNIYSYKSDIWAIGVIFYEMLTGKTPWRAKTEGDLKKIMKSNSIKNLLPPKITKISEEFLVKTLAFEPENRMCPEQILKFFDKQSGELEMLIEPKKLVSSLNGPNFRTRAVSQDNANRNPNASNQFFISNNISGQKTFKKINLLKGMAGEFSNDGKFLKTRATIKQKSENQGSFELIDPKKISNQLVSQLHLCRFMFKLIERMDNNQFIDESEKLKTQMSLIIFKKLNQLKNLTLLEDDVATEFRGFPEFSKLYNLCDQYQQKYKKYFPSSNLFIQYSPESIDQLIQSEIATLFTYVIEFQTNPEQVRDQVIILDYLITLKQLLNLDENNCLEIFQKKSKIQDIIEGKPTSHITKEHITTISAKIKTMKIV